MRKRKVTVILVIALLLLLAGCGGTSGADDVPPTNSIESSQPPTETPETPTEPIAEPSAEPTTTPSQEPTTEPTEEPKETVTPSEEPTPEATQEPTTTPPATPTPAPVSTPVPTPAPTPTPAPVHTHSYKVTTLPTCVSAGVETCNCGDSKTVPATGQHTYTTQTIQGTGHMEQVQVGTEQVLVRNETRQYYECLACKSHIYSYEDLEAHTDPSSPSFSPNCAFSRTLIHTESIPIYEEQPKYENQWVVDTPDTTIRVCSVCGHQE